MSAEPLKSDHLSTVLSAIQNPRVLVLGDFILDRYTWGNTNRVSPEAPVVVLKADRQEVRLGGASGVCHLARGLEADVVAVGVVGDDEAGAQICAMLEKSNVDISLTKRIPNQSTTIKERFIGRAADRHPQQILRVDHEACQPLQRETEQELFASIETEIQQCQAVLISDYEKGVCTPWLICEVVAAAKRCHVPVVIDPGPVNDCSHYRSATLLTPNRHELQLATGKKINKADDAIEIGRGLREQLDLDAIIVTLDRDGMALIARDGTGRIFPTKARKVYDITGAGDMVLAMLGFCVAAGLSFPDSVQLANLAAGREVECLGLEPVTLAQIRSDLAADSCRGIAKVVSLEALDSLVELLHRDNQRIVFTNGCFDVLHIGHAYYLQQASQLGDVLIVGVNSDQSVRKLKGDGRPIHGEQHRAELLAALNCVDYVAVFEEDTPHEMLRRIRPDVLVKGGTYTVAEVVGKEIVESYGGEVRVTGQIDGQSTTQILRMLRGDDDSSHDG